MKKLRMLVILLIVFPMLSLELPQDSQAAQDSKGTEFWVTFMENYRPNSRLEFFITSEFNTSGLLEIPSSAISIPFNVTANVTTTVTLPSVIFNQGIHIKANAEVTVYGLNQLQHSTDAYLALPLDTLNTTYYVMTYANTTFHGSDAEQFSIVAPYDGTDVTFTIPGQAPQMVTLNQGDVYAYEGTGYDGFRLCGTYIKASRPVAVFGGNQCTNIPWNGNVGACDHVVEQIPPIATWGTTFYTVPLATRRQGDTFVVIAGATPTDVMVNGSLVATLAEGSFHEMIVGGKSLIETSEPSLVAQFSNSSEYDGVTSDPFMMIVPPIEQALTHYTFSTPSQLIPTNFVNVVVETSEIGSLQLDGSAINPALFASIGATGFSGAEVPIAVGSHYMISTSSAPFGIHVYGFANYDSYGYPGGMAFEFIFPRGDAWPPICECDQNYNCTAADDRPSEDTNGNGILDLGEDTNNNGQIDEDKGIFVVQLEPGAVNLALIVEPFVPGDPMVNYSVQQIDPDVDGEGVIEVIDGAGNRCRTNVYFSGQGFCGDLDGDGDVDGDDRNILRGAYRTSMGNPGFIPEADYDQDGDIDYTDYREWYQCYKSYVE